MNALAHKGVELKTLMYYFTS